MRQHSAAIISKTGAFSSTNSLFSGHPSPSHRKMKQSAGFRSDLDRIVGIHVFNPGSTTMGLATTTSRTVSEATWMQSE